MTLNEAIEMLNNIQVDTRDLKHALKCSDLIETAVKALEEVQEYQKLGTVEELTDVLQVISESEDDVDESGISIGTIKDLAELSKYRKIGTLAKVEEAVEKNNPKKPDYEGDGYADGKMVYDTWYCPNCGQSYEVDYDDYKCCPNCGQKIDWSAEE